MKVLSIKNPHAYLIAYGIKDIENRSWKTPYRGKLLIHVSGNSESEIVIDYLPEKIKTEYRNAIDSELDEVEVSEPLYNLDELALIGQMHLEKTKEYFFQAGLIIAEVELIDITKNHPSIWAEKNCYNWILSNPVLLKNPIKTKGKLGLWEYNL